MIDYVIVDAYLITLSSEKICIFVLMMFMVSVNKYFEFITLQVH